MGLPAGIQAVMQRLMQQGGQMGGDFDASAQQAGGWSGSGTGGFGESLGIPTAQPGQDMGFGQPQYMYQGVPPPAHPSNPYSQYAALPQIQPTDEETAFAAAKAKGAEKHTGGFSARLKDALKAFGVNALAGLAQGNGLAALAGGVAGGIGNLINPQLIHNQMAAQNLAGLQQAATASRTLADQRMNQQMALGNYQHKGLEIGQAQQRLDQEQTTRQGTATQRRFENALQAYKEAIASGADPASLKGSWMDKELQMGDLAGFKPIQKHGERYVQGVGMVATDPRTFEPIKDQEGNYIISKDPGTGKPLQHFNSNGKLAFIHPDGTVQITNTPYGEPVKTTSSTTKYTDAENPQDRALLDKWNNDYANLKKQPGLEDISEEQAIKHFLGPKPKVRTQRVEATTERETRPAGTAPPAARGKTSTAQGKSLTSAQYNLQVQKHGKEAVDKWLADNGYKVNP